MSSRASSTHPCACRKLEKATWNTFKAHVFVRGEVVWNDKVVLEGHFQQMFYYFLPDFSSLLVYVV